MGLLMSVWASTVSPLPVPLRKPAGTEGRARLLTLGCTLQWLHGSVAEQGLLSLWG